MKIPLWLIVSILVIELGAVLLLVPGSFTKDAIQKESAYVESSLGPETSEWINNKADSWHKLIMIDSGIERGIYRTFIPTEKARKESRGMEEMGQFWFDWIKGRINTLSEVVYQFLARIALLVVWSPYMLILLVPAVYDGLMTWRIKRTNFDYASPIIHRYGVRSIGYLFLAFCVVSFSPFAVSPLVIPVVMMITCILIGFAIGNFQKRV
ncbi:DUF4400 domain-containing protein [Marinomonas sp. A79]|uniref:DUF4400 domain-containing protein n=1 Tax=Marinomonas vulgaris TaxID=2823372 RepID=A0ABS5HEF3_9GAMM|nr:DUF4400 domain-containing protein [Marinomonas vulgaris]MBR7889834.1 DUF4400 domain-containing protein [Marinomonas vulgaris]